MDETFTINQKELDILNEVASIGAGSATTALSQLLNRQIALKLPQTILVNSEKVPELFADNREVMVGIDIAFFGDLVGRAFLYLSRDDAIKLSSLGIDYTDKIHNKLTEMDKSFLNEVTNIVVASYINSLAKICGFQILSSVPYLDIDMLNKLILSLVDRNEHKGELNLFVNISLEIQGLNVSGNMLLFFREESLKLILSKLSE